MIRNYIDSVNKKGNKVLSLFLTCGFPDRKRFLESAFMALDNGADMLEIGIPFSDPLADGPVIQKSSLAALDQGIKINDVLKLTEKIRNKTDRPLILMGYANPIVNYGVKNFFADASSSGASGIIVPDVPADEYDSFFPACTNNIDVILLTSTLSSRARILKIDDKSSGFVYCVSAAGTTGERDYFNDDTINGIKRVRNILRNKMMVGFGISTPESINRLYDTADGFISGSAIISSLYKDFNENSNYSKTSELIQGMKKACLAKRSEVVY